MFGTTYRCPGPGAALSTAIANTNPNPELASSISQAVASQATSAPAHTNVQPTNSLISPIHVLTNPATFNNF